MRKIFLGAALAAAALPPSLGAQAPTRPQSAPEIVKSAPAAHWMGIAPDDLLVMTLAPDAQGKARQVIIQLLPPPFSQGWIGNMRKLATAHWWDGGAIYRVQDNWVAQFGDPDEDTPKAKPLPPGLAVVPESAYETAISTLPNDKKDAASPQLTRWTSEKRARLLASGHGAIPPVSPGQSASNLAPQLAAIMGGMLSAIDAGSLGDPYATDTGFYQGFPIALSGEQAWPTHCYATVGVGRNNSPDTGTGAELYAVIGTPPRQLDRNIAVVGRVIEGIEYLSSLPRAPGNGMYNDKAKNTPIQTIRLASALPPAEQPRFQYLSTNSRSFADYAQARVNRRDSFYIYAAGSADICNIPVPIRRAP